ncbi:hypothetical protein Dsin_028764 [Dipteronia sinensis]|uniref:Prolyl endopeptidase-like n=1 Tax=Dipteronia sinensis TaxID=43782 RepID=A0AAE0DUK0_9ROSI|nr:hypothetical protein Dsin_028764 [Dipteronia sinensis]
MLLRRLFCNHISFLCLPRLPTFSHFSKPTMSSHSLPQSPSPPPPVAKKVEHVLEMFGDVRVDNYYWLRDDSRSDPEILSHLNLENNYTNSVMSGTKKFEDELFGEIKGRVKEDDISAPIRRGEYYYYKRYLQGKEYVQYCRRLVPTNDTAPSVYDTMPTGLDAPPEHVIFDENVKAQNHSFYSIGAFKVSMNNKLVAYAEDTKGDEIYTVYVIDAETGAPVDKPLSGLTPYLEWAGDEALVYITMDEILRPDKVWLHKLGNDQSSDICLYHEKDDIFSLDLEASESKKFLFIGSESKITRSIFYLDVAKPEDLRVLTPRVVGVDTSVSHCGNHFIIRRRTDDLFNSELLACPVDNTSETMVLIPHRESVKIQGKQLFIEHLAVYERENGLPKITTYRLPPVGEPLKSLQDGKTVDFVDPIYSIEQSESQFSSSILRFYYSSMKTPRSVYDYDMNTGISVLKKIETVLGGFNSSNYVTERKWASASDATQIPISIVYRKNLVKLDGSDPLLLYGYGSYEEWGDPRKKEFYFYMKSYSPVDNVKAQNYPYILVTAGLNDPRVMYSEPAKFVAKLRDMKTDDNILLFKCEFGAGHSSKSGRFEKLQEDAFTFTFILKALNRIPASTSGQS